MDEPTNHLDIKSKNVLKEALNNFEGTLVLVSHDRDFLQGLCNNVYEFKDQKIKEYLGGIEYYLEQRKISSMREAELKSEEKKGPKEASNKQEYTDQKKDKALKNKLSNIEADILKLEREIAVMDENLAKNYESTSSKPEFFKKYENKKAELESKMQKWEEVQATMDSLT
jgi:ATP-binding cassette subfamily F protein 3